MLDLWKIRTTSINMKLSSPIVGLVLIGLLVPLTLADISLKLKNKSYLPPAKQEVQEKFKNTPLKSQHQQRQTFREDKYANSRYQIFEVHNHYEPPAGNSLKEPAAQINNGYLPAQQQEEKIHIQHINTPSDFPLDNLNLDASYLGLASDGDTDNRPIIVKHETRATVPNKSPSHNVPVPFPSNYQHRSRQTVQGSAIQDQMQQYVNKQIMGSNYLSTHNTQQQTQQLSHLKQNSFNGNQPHTSQININPISNTIKGPDYLPPHNGNNKMVSFNGPIYLPPHQSSSSMPQLLQQTSFGQNIQYKGPNYLPPPNGKSRNHQQQTTFQTNNPLKGPDYLPPYKKGYGQENIPFKGALYLPPHTEGSPQQHMQSYEENNSFKGPDYLPPQNDKSGQHQSISLQQNFAFKRTDYMPPQGKQQSEYENVQTSSQLPSDYISQKPSNSEQAIAELHTLPEQQTEQQYKQEVTVGTQIQVTGREKSNNIIYGSPKQSNPLQSVSSHQTNGYLPPGYDFRNPENDQQPIDEMRRQVPRPQAQIPVAVLPSGYDFQKPENSEEAIAQLHSKDTFTLQQSQESNPVKTPEYDMIKSKNTINQMHNINTVQVQHISRSASQNIGGQPFNAPGYLPPENEFQKQVDIQPALNQLHSLSNGYQTTQNLEQIYNHQVQSDGQLQQQPQTYNQAQISQQAENYQNQESQQQTYSRVQSPQIGQQMQIFKTSDYLPPSASAADLNQHETQPSAQAFKSPDYLPPIASPQRESVSYKAPDYLPPVASVSSPLPQISQPQFKGPDYLPPISAPQVNAVVAYQANNQETPQQPQFKAAEYLPPTTSTPAQPIQATYMYPLSSYMTTVKPNERYGSARKPFLEYGLPSTTASTFFANNEVSSMYREPATRPQYYAPTMSYEKNAINTQTYTTYKQKQYEGTSALNHQTRQTLQNFMPKDLRSSTGSVAATALHTTKPASAKIRTVQIINTNAVKSLKVLEYLDHAGAKIIKILGPSHEEPKGDHRVVRVVSAHNHSEQIVKIFNDQQDVTLAVNQSHSPSNNSYLPPRHKRNAHNKSEANLK